MGDLQKRLSGPAALTTSAATQYTVPGSTSTILRSIHVANTSASVVSTLTLSIGADAAGTRLFAAFPIPGSGVLDWSGFIVLNAADIIQALASVATLTLTISGVEVT